MAFGGLLGILLHAGKAMYNIKKRNETTFNNVFQMYWKTEWMSFLGSILCFGVLLFVASEFVNLESIDEPDPAEDVKERLLHFKISNFIKLSSVIAGYFADSIVYGFLGVTEIKLKKKLADAETNATQQQ